MSNKLIRICNLSLHYEEQRVLQDISLDIEAGDYIALIGPNGSGKTTLVKALLGLIRPSTGEIIRMPQPGREFQIGYLPQKTFTQDKIFPATVEEIIRTGLLGSKKHPRIFNRNDMQKVTEVLEQLSISELRGKRIGNLSGGQQQRVFLARALVGEPKMLVMDEPTSALDPQIRDEFYTLMHRLNKKSGVTILLVSHDITSVGKYTDKMIYLDRKLVFFGDYASFCKSDEMTRYFGDRAQHQICWRHADGTNHIHHT